MNKAQLAKRIYEAAYLTGDFLLRSGKRSHEYFDKYQFESRPDLLKEIASQLALLIPPGTQFLAGLEMGGIPIATALSLQTSIPVIFVRKEAKQYGTCRFAEGADITGKKLCIVEDVITSGGQVLLSSKDLRAEGALVDTVLCVINRSGLVNPFSENDLNLKALFTIDELKEASR